MKNFISKYLTAGKNKWETAVVNCFIAGVFLGGAFAAVFIFNLFG